MTKASSRQHLKDMQKGGHHRGKMFAAFGPAVSEKETAKHGGASTIVPPDTGH